MCLRRRWRGRCMRARTSIAIEAVRGRGVTGFANSALVRQQTSGQRAGGEDCAARGGSGSAGPDAQRAGVAEFDDALRRDGSRRAFMMRRGSRWRAFGGIESNIEMYQWNADAGLYNWPGYDGISPFLAHMPIARDECMASYAGRGSFDGIEEFDERRW